MDSIKAFVDERRTGWQTTQIARIMLGGNYEYFPAINIMNNGCISNMNDDVAFGNKEKALQALLIDPYISSVKKAEAMQEDVLDHNKQYDIRF